MSLDGLRGRLDIAGLEDLWSEFGGDDIDRFLGWLHEHGHIDLETFVALEGSGELRIAGLETIGLLPENSIELLEEGKVEGYDVLGQVGRGGVGEVLVVREHDLGRRVALKRLLPEAVQQRDIVARFYREVQITAQLEHPSIIPVYRLERAASEIAYTMKLVQGDTLKDLIDDARARLASHERLPASFSVAARIRLFLRACEAMAYAHSRGYIHRDLKPSNIMRGAFGEVYVMDWGIARRTDGDEIDPPPRPFDEDVEATQIGMAIGTPAYMAPEQAMGGEDVGTASDQYALGLILQELLTLQRARPGSRATELLQAASLAERNEPAPIPGAQPLDEDLQAILRVACHPEPEQRYDGVRELAADLEHYLDGEETSARPDSPSRRLERILVRHRQATLLVLVGLLVVVFASIAGNLYRRQAKRKAEVREDEAMDVLLAHASRHSYGVAGAFARYEGEVRALAAAARQGGGLEDALRSATADPVVLDAFVGWGNGAVEVWPPIDLPAGFDPRTRPWYTQGIDASEPVWGRPYADAADRGLVLPCSVAIGSDRAGVIGLDLDIDLLTSSVLMIPEIRGVRAASLLDGEGMVLASTGAWNTTGVAHSNEALVSGVQGRRSGKLERMVAGSAELTVYYRLGALDWTWVVEGDRDLMLGY